MVINYVFIIFGDNISFVHLIFIILMFMEGELSCILIDYCNTYNLIFHLHT